MIHHTINQSTQIMEQAPQNIAFPPIPLDIININTVKNFVESGMDLEAKYGMPGETLLHHVVRNYPDSIDIVTYLLDKGANINEATYSYNNYSFGHTPLHIASFRGHYEIAKYLVDRGANIEAVTIENETPLFKAACNGHAVIAKYLLDCGANKEHKNENGITVYQIADQPMHSDLIEHHEIGNIYRYNNAIALAQWIQDYDPTPTKGVQYDY
jgi:ankyrin repeat protein